MEFLTVIVAAEDDEYVAVGESTNPLAEWSGFEANGIDTMRLATLHSLLTGDSLQSALDTYEPIYVGENETSVLRVADELFDKLVDLEDDALVSVSEELAATEEFESAGWDAEELIARLAPLGELARLAESQAQILFVWINAAPE